MGTPFNLTIMSVSSAFGTSTTIPLGSAATVNGTLYLTFATAGTTTGTVVDYSILDTGASEIGTAIFSSVANTLTSRTPTKSTNSNAAITASSAALILGCVRAESLTPYITTGQYLGVSDGSSATAGNVGEFTSQTVAASSAVAVTLTTGTAANVTSIGLLAGDYDLTGVVGYIPGPGATQTAIITWISSVSATLPTAPNNGGYYQFIGTLTAGAGNVAPAGNYRVTTATSGTYFLGTLSNFSSGCQAYGYISARRRR